MANDLSLSLKISALVDGIKQVDQLAKEVKDLTRAGKEKLPDSTQGLRDGATRTKSAVAGLARELRGLIGLAAITKLVKDSVAALRQAESAFKGLEAVANFTGVGIERAFAESTRIASDGLISVADASKALQNLLSRGYNLDQAVQTINRLKDAAAFNRAAHLSLSEAVVTATEGLKNENSTLVDNAGVTKNVSILWKEYAESIGKTVADLTQQEKIQAEVNGILRETEAQVGNAAKAAGGAEGQIARFTQASFELKAVLGDALIPAITTLFEWGVTLTNEWLKPGIGYLKGFAAYAGATAKSLVDAVSGDFRLIGNNFAIARDMMNDYVDEAKRGVIDVTRNIKDNIDHEALARRNAAKAEEDRRRAAEAANELDRKRLALVTATLKAQSALNKDELDRQQDILDRNLKEALVSYRDYYAQRSALQRVAIDDEIRVGAQALAEQRRVLAETKKEEDRIPILGQIRQLEAELIILRRKRGDVARVAGAEELEAERKLADELVQVRIRLLEAQGQGAAARQAGLEREFRDLLKRLQIEGDREGEALVRKLFNVEVARGELDQLRTEYDRALAQMALIEQDITAQREAGLIGEIEARRRIIALHKDTRDAVAATIPKMREAAAAIGPEAVAQVDALAAAWKRLGTEIDLVAQRINDSIKKGMVDGLASFVDGTKSAKEAFNDFADSVVAAINRIAAEEIASQIFGGLNLGSFGNFFAGLFHSGGIAGQPGAGRLVSPLAFAGAPRLHGGGMLGLAPDEVPAILQEGEEVLTRGDPRHRANGGGGFTMNVYTQDAGSFRRAQGQIEAEASMLLDRARRRNR